MAQDYSLSASHTWTPDAPDVGTHEYRVWVRSAGSTALFEAYRYSPVFTVADVLDPPAVIPGPGTYASGQPIVLTAEQEADIRYTLDGSDPSSSSALYTTPLRLPLGTSLLKARAFKTGWGASAVASWSYEIRTEVNPPTIIALASPTPNAAGWNNTDVVVTFACADAESGIATCSPPVTRWANKKGAVVTGEAVDNAGNRAIATVVVNIDKIAPAITVHAPEESDVIPPDATELQIRGNAADQTSGLASVTCGGVPGTVQNQQFTCAVALGLGANAVRIEAQDLAGNTSTRDLTLLVDDPPSPTAIEITPATMTLLPGELRKLRVVDQRGRAITGGTFTVANTLVAQIEITDNIPFVRGIGGGETTISLTREELTAEASVTVLPVGTTTIPNGTTLWALKPVPPPPYTGLLMRGRVLRAVPVAVADGVEQPALFFVEHEYYNTKPARVTATTWDGRALWSYSRSERVEQFAADNQGGVVLVTSGYYESSFYTRYSVKRLDGITGAISWEYVSFSDHLSSVAIHPDGTIYVVQSPSDYTASLLALDGDSGALRARVSLGDWYRQVASAPLVRQDGRVAVVTVRVSSDWSGPTQTILSEVDSETLAMVEHEITTSNLSVQDHAPLKSGPKRLMSDGHDGLLVLASDLGAVYRIANNYTLSNPFYLRFNPFYYNWPRLAPQMVLGTDVAYALVQDHPYASQNAADWGPPKVVAFHPVTLAPLGTTYLSQDAEQYLLHSVAANGAAVVTGPEWGNAQEVWPGISARVEDAMALQVDSEQGLDNNESPYWGGNAQAGFGPLIPCGVCTRGYTPPDGHGAASPSDNRRVITVAIDSSWNTGLLGFGPPNERILGATNCAISMWNTATDQYGNYTGYFFRLHDSEHDGWTPDITIANESCSEGAGWACSTFPETGGTSRFDLPSRLKLPANNLDTLDQFICARIAHEFAHKLGGNGKGLCRETILQGSYADGTRDLSACSVFRNDVELVNIALNHPERCTGYDYGKEPPGTARTWTDSLESSPRPTPAKVGVSQRNRGIRQWISRFLRLFSGK